MSSITNQFDFSFKIVLIGDKNVGKSQIFNRFVKNCFEENHKSTIGMEIGTKLFEREKQKINIQLWDTMGEEQYKSLAKIYYKGAMGALTVFDLTNKDSFLNVLKWIENIKQNTLENVPIIIVGNKSDLVDKRIVKEEEAKLMAINNSYLYIETSAKTSFNIKDTFELLIAEIIKIKNISLNINSKHTSDTISFGKKIEEDPIKLSILENNKDKKNKGNNNSKSCC